MQRIVFSKLVLFSFVLAFISACTDFKEITSTITVDRPADQEQTICDGSEITVTWDLELKNGSDPSRSIDSFIIQLYATYTYQDENDVPVEVIGTSYYYPSSDSEKGLANTVREATFTLDDLGTWLAEPNLQLPESKSLPVNGVTNPLRSAVFPDDLYGAKISAVVKAYNEFQIQPSVNTLDTVIFPEHQFSEEPNINTCDALNDESVTSFTYTEQAGFVYAPKFFNGSEWKTPSSIAAEGKTKTAYYPLVNGKDYRWKLDWQTISGTCPGTWEMSEEQSFSFYEPSDAVGSVDCDASELILTFEPVSGFEFFVYFCDTESTPVASCTAVTNFTMVDNNREYRLDMNEALQTSVWKVASTATCSGMGDFSAIYPGMVSRKVLWYGEYYTDEEAAECSANFVTWGTEGSSNSFPPPPAVTSYFDEVNVLYDKRIVEEDAEGNEVVVSYGCNGIRTLPSGYDVLVIADTGFEFDIKTFDGRIIVTTDTAPGSLLAQLLDPREEGGSTSDPYNGYGAGELWYQFEASSLTTTRYFDDDYCSGQSEEINIPEKTHDPGVAWPLSYLTITNFNATNRNGTTFEPYGDIFSAHVEERTVDTPSEYLYKITHVDPETSETYEWYWLHLGFVHANSADAEKESIAKMIIYVSQKILGCVPDSQIVYPCE
jgi:hypothetical protein